MKKTKSKVANIVGWVFLSFCLIVLAGVAFITIDAKVNNRPVSVFGHQFFFVITGSMEPTIKTNGMAITSSEDFTDIEVGDIVAFRSAAMNDQIAIHRVIGLTDEGAITQGDNNSNPDGGFVTNDNYQGTVTFKTNITADFLSGLQQPGGVLKTIVLPILIVALVVLGYRFITWGKDWRYRGFTISIIALLISSSILVSFHLYVSRRQNVINEKLIIATQEFLDKQGEVKTYLNGKEIIGSIEIPKLELKYPIIRFVKRASLETSISLYSGSELNHPGNSVLIGEHSFGNVFFTKIDELKTGDEIIITAESVTKTYIVESSNKTHSSDLSAIAQTNNEDQMTLISTDYDMLDWFVVRAVAK